jgi:hypothetical protein
MELCEEFFLGFVVLLIPFFPVQNLGSSLHNIVLVRSYNVVQLLHMLPKVQVVVKFLRVSYAFMNSLHRSL